MTAPTATRPARMTAAEARRQLRLAQAAPLADKIARARAVLAAAYDAAGDPGRVWVAFSGGRDSTALLHLARTVAGPSALAYHVDTGHAWPGLAEWLAAFGGEALVTIPPARDLVADWARYGAPVGGKVSARAYRRAIPGLPVDPEKCCRIHKAEPGHAFLRRAGAQAVAFGARGEDSKRYRFHLARGEILATPDGWTAAYPLITWTGADVDAYLAEHVPGAPLYHRQQELGCRGCAVDLVMPVNNLALLRRQYPDEHRRLVTETPMGLVILAIRYGLTLDGARALVDRDGWPALIAAGHLDRIPPAPRGLTGRGAP